MRTTLGLLAVLMLGGCADSGCVSATFAQSKGAADEKVKKPPQVVVPARTIEFVKIDEPYTCKMFRAAPELLEQKFAAQFRLLRPEDNERNRNRTGFSGWFGAFEGFPTVLPSPISKGSDPVAQYSFSLLSFRLGRSYWKANEYFDALIKLVPKDKRPAKQMEDFLRKQLSEGLIWVKNGHIVRFPNDAPRSDSAIGYGRDVTMDVGLMAPTEELARESTRAWLTLFDEGISRYAQTNVLKDRAKAALSLQTAQQELEKRNSVAQAKAKTLHNTAAIDASAIAEFRLRQHLLEVDLAGIRARIQAADQLLSQLRGKPGALNRIDQVQNLKIAAEIELAGLAAQQQALARLIKLGEDRATLASEAAKAMSLAQGKRREIVRHTDLIASYDKALEAVAPFKLIDHKVTIRPVKWESK